MHMVGIKIQNLERHEFGSFLQVKHSVFRVPIIAWTALTLSLFGDHRPWTSSTRRIQSTLWGTRRWRSSWTRYSFWIRHSFRIAKASWLAKAQESSTSLGLSGLDGHIRLEVAGSVCRAIFQHFGTVHMICCLEMSLLGAKLMDAALSVLGCIKAGKVTETRWENHDMLNLLNRLDYLYIWGDWRPNLS